MAMLFLLCAGGFPARGDGWSAVQGRGEEWHLSSSYSSSSSGSPEKRGTTGQDGKGGGKKGGKGGSDAKKTAPKPLKFVWPTTGRKIVQGYGERKNPETGTVTMNPGINIAARKGSAVVAAEGGKVSLISWLPSYGTIMIIEHRGGYRTVYGNLASTSVSRGTTVRSGQRIGTVGRALSGAALHFEVWRDQTRLDPRTVLP